MFSFETGGGQVAIRLTGPKSMVTGSDADDGFPSDVNNLRATLRLLNANGMPVLDASGAPLQGVFDFDGFDEPIFNLQLPPGTYYLQVGSFGQYADVGQYLLSVVEDGGARVVNTEFLSLSPGHVGLLVTFNEPVNPLTFTTHDVRVNGGAAGQGVIDVVLFGDSKRFLVTLSTSYVMTMNVSVGPDIADQFGNRMDQNGNGLKGELSDQALASYLVGFAGGDFGYHAEEPVTFESPRTRTRLSSRYAVDLMFAEY